MSIKGISSHEQYKLNHRINSNGIMERRCTTCGEWKEENINNFYMMNKKKPKMGFASGCKVCMRTKQQKRIDDNPDYNRTTALRHYYLKRDKEIARLKQWRQDHAEHKYNYQKAYDELHKEERKQYNENRFLHKNHEITPNEWEACKKYSDYRCAYCGMPLELHYEIVGTDFHKEHNDSNGSNLLDNCIPSCASCNYKKWKHEFEVWYNEDNTVFNQEYLDKINQWKTFEYKLYIEPKLPYRILRRRNEDNRTYHFELWSIDNKRDITECLSIKNKKEELKEDIQKYYNIV